jgi:thiamine transport system permease protein
MAAYTRLQARVARPLELRPRQVTQRRLRRRREWLVIALNVGPMLVLLIAPLAALVERSLTLSTARGVSLAFYRQLFENPRGSAFYVPPVAAVRNSVGFAPATVGLSVALGLMAAAVMDDRGAAHSPRSRGPRPRGQWLRRLLDPVFMLPLGTSAVTLGLGYIVALDEPPLDLRTSPLLVVLAHTLVALPLCRHLVASTCWAEMLVLGFWTGDITLRFLPSRNQLRQQVLFLMATPSTTR